MDQIINILIVPLPANTIKLSVSVSLDIKFAQSLMIWKRLPYISSSHGVFLLSIQFSMLSLLANGWSK